MQQQESASKRLVRYLSSYIPYIPFSRSFTQRRWVSDEYNQFGLDQRKFIFLSIARFCHINRPIDGYYMEFGSHEANTMRIAWDQTRHLFNWQYIAFDSFQGLPEIKEIDKQQIWEKGKLKTEEESFISILLDHGIPRNRFQTVKGFYSDSLTPALRDRLLPKKAAVIYVDCDLYESTVDVLKFSRDFLQRGTIIVFDDWNCFHGDPEKGERLAFREFCEANPQLKFEPFVSTNEGQSFIFLGESAK